MENTSNFCCTCQVVLRKKAWEPYCQRCYQRAFPFCHYCKNPICEDQEKIGSYHKYPCYSLEKQKCCECFASIDGDKGDGIYCVKCYEIKNAAPLQLYIKCKDNEFSLHSRDDKVVDALRVFANGIITAIKANVKQQSAVQESGTEEPPQGFRDTTSFYANQSAWGVSGAVARSLGSSVIGTTGFVARNVNRSVREVTGFVGRSVSETTGFVTRNVDRSVRGTTGFVGKSVIGTTGFVGRSVSGTTGFMARNVDKSVRGVASFVTRNIDRSLRGVTNIIAKRLL
ncbi:PREDICTED: uncharacterized protein LOC107339558 [Acropora digitifera]|uniref:uncharacterized protein LOC107339558 n=1 Tax=Acropora digitifera TaxID=70779 RepID=UPI00077A9B97|nr:PREDICTED: uncharacterized protein LOC107339558 [Acropora digitifera]